MKNSKQILSLLLGAALVFSACKKDEETEEDTADANAGLKQSIVSTYADVVYESYKDSYDSAVEMQNSLSAFTANPTQSNMDVAKQSWLDAREPYGQTEAFRFASGPIDAENGPEGLLNSWPLDEAYIDYVDNDGTILTVGIVNEVSTYPTLSPTDLLNENQPGEEESNVSIGYHAIEFLLWGQDNTDPSALMAGQRPFTDFVDGGTASNQDRRRVYLNSCASLLLVHLDDMVDAWSPTGGDNYRSQFLDQPTDVSLTQILTGAGVLAKSELAGERIFTAYDEQDQEQEHSCFSDNTHRDTRLNAAGIRNVLTGCYIKTDGISKITGPSIVDLLELVDASFKNDFVEQMNQGLSAIEATAIPFDYAINSPANRPDVLTAVNEMQEFGDKIAEAASIIGLTISTEGPG